MSTTSSKMSRTTTKLGLIVLGFALAVISMLVAVDPELAVSTRFGLGGMLLVGGIASMVRAFGLDTDASVRPDATGSGSRR